MNFIKRLFGKNEKQPETKSPSDKGQDDSSVSENDSISDRVIAVIREKTSSRNILDVINGDTPLHAFGIDMIDLVEIQLGLEKEFGITFLETASDVCGPATEKFYYEYFTTVREDTFDSADIGTVQLYTDIVKELLQNKKQKKSEERESKAADSELPVEKEAQFELGKMYYFGIDVSQDREEAFKWFMKSAEQGYAEAQYRAGLSLMTGDGITQDMEKGLELMLKAAEQGLAEAQFGLGTMLVSSSNANTKADGVEWLAKAAEQGYEDALTVLSGISEPKDDFSEIVLHAQTGNVDAQYALAVCYVNGEYVEKDLEEAAKWFLKAAEQGHSDAQLSLGRMYLDGLGVDINYREAAKFLMLSAKQGNKNAIETLNSKKTKSRLSGYDKKK